MTDTELKCFSRFQSCLGSRIALFSAERAGALPRLGGGFLPFY